MSKTSFPMIGDPDVMVEASSRRNVLSTEVEFILYLFIEFMLYLYKRFKQSNYDYKPIF